MKATLEESISRFLEAERDADKRCAFTKGEREQRAYFIGRVQAHLEAATSEQKRLLSALRLAWSIIERCGGDDSDSDAWLREVRDENLKPLLSEYGLTNADH